MVLGKCPHCGAGGDGTAFKGKVLYQPYKSGEIWKCLNNGCNVRIFVEEMPVDDLVRKYGEVIRKSDKVEIPVNKDE